MTNWTAGYVEGIGYTHGYFGEMSPGRLSLAALNRGLAVRLRQPWRYLELGFGRGLSLAIHAAACDGEFWGTDFDPCHAAGAKELVEACGAQARILDDSFEDFAARDDLPEFDIIVLHGVWSWVSAANRSTIIELARRKLAAGGLLYVSYNCLPGAAPMMPVQHLLNLHAELAGSAKQGAIGRVKEAVAFVGRLADHGTDFFRVNPAVPMRLNMLTQQAPAYLAHEYFNRDWPVMGFSEVCARLAEAKLTFAASAALADHVDALNLSREDLRLLADIGHPVLRESVRDHIVNAQFRRDVFVKGERRLGPIEKNGLYGARRFILTTLLDDVPLKFVGRGEDFMLSNDVHRPILAALAECLHAPKRLSDIVASAGLHHVPASALNEAILFLCSTGHVCPAQDHPVIASVDQRCGLLNAHIIDRARHGGDIVWLASPVTGAGVAVSRIEQLFLHARSTEGDDNPAWVRHAWECLKASGSQLMKQGAVIDGKEESLFELHAQASAFAVRRMPVLQALRIVRN